MALMPISLSACGLGFGSTAGIFSQNSTIRSQQAQNCKENVNQKLVLLILSLIKFYIFLEG